MPQEFTLSELQAMSEAVLGEKLDKVTFRRRMDVAGVATALEGQMRSGAAFRPAQLYTLEKRTAAPMSG
jgi:8-oxo-dGTP diphosphatase